MLVYDVTDEKSFEKISYWIRDVEEVCLVRYHMTYHVVQRAMARFNIDPLSL